MHTTLTRARIRGRRFRSHPLRLPPQSKALRVRLHRGLLDTRLALTLVAEVDGVRYHCRDEDAGAADGRALTLDWLLPWGFFGGDTCQRLAFRAHEARYWLEVEREGRRLCDTACELSLLEDPAPHLVRHNSVAFDTATGALSTTNNGTISLSHTAGAGADRAAFIGSSISCDDAPTSLDATYGGAAAPLIDLTAAASGGSDLITGASYVLDSTIGSGAKTVEVTATGYGGSVYGKTLSVITMSGVSQSAPIGTPGEHVALSGTGPSVTLSSPAAGSLLCDHISTWVGAGGSITAGAGQTSRAAGQGGSGDQFRYGASTQPGSSGGVMSWSKATSDFEFCLLAVEFLEETGGGGGGTILPQLMQHYYGGPS